MTLATITVQVELNEDMPRSSLAAMVEVALDHAIHQRPVEPEFAKYFGRAGKLAVTDIDKVTGRMDRSLGNEGWKS